MILFTFLKFFLLSKSCKYLFKLLSGYPELLYGDWIGGSDDILHLLNTNVVVEHQDIDTSVARIDDKNRFGGKEEIDVEFGYGEKYIKHLKNA